MGVTSVNVTGYLDIHAQSTSVSPSNDVDTVTSLIVSDAGNVDVPLDQKMPQRELKLITDCQLITECPLITDHQ